VAGVTGFSGELAQDAKTTGLHCAAETNELLRSSPQIVGNALFAVAEI
jgi:hypothetical protein